MSIGAVAAIFATSFLVSLTGALSPGPLTTLAVREGVRRGVWAGPAPPGSGQPVSDRSEPERRCEDGCFLTVLTNGANSYVVLSEHVSDPDRPGGRKPERAGQDLLQGAEPI